MRRRGWMPQPLLVCVAMLANAATIRRPASPLHWGIGPVKMHLSVCADDECAAGGGLVLDYDHLGTLADTFDGTCDTLDWNGPWDAVGQGGIHVHKFYWAFERGFDPAKVDPGIDCGDGSQPIWDLKCPFVEFFEQP